MYVVDKFVGNPKIISELPIRDKGALIFINAIMEHILNLLPNSLEINL